MTQLARLGPTHAEALINARLLDVLLSVYLRCNIVTNATLFDTCTSVLSAVVTYPNAFTLLCKHPVHLLWPRRALLPLSWVVAMRIKDRQEAWAALGNIYCTLRLDRIRDGAPLARELTRSPADALVGVEWNALLNTTTYLFDDLIDLIEFTRFVSSRSCIFAVILMSVIEHLYMGGSFLARLTNFSKHMFGMINLRRRGIQRCLTSKLWRASIPEFFRRQTLQGLL
jgi:hypothetical protein